MGLIKPRNTIWTEFKILILALVIFLVFPAIIILIIPIYIIRYLVSVSSRHFKPDLGKILNSFSAFYAPDDMFNKPRSSIVSFIVVEGKLHLYEMRRYQMGKTVERDSSTGELKVPQFQQYISKWMGFYFWKWDQTFQIENHVLEYDGEVSCGRILSQGRLYQIYNELVTKPWSKKRSPWQILLIPDYRCENDATPEVPKSLVIFRYDHSLADGMSALKMIYRDRTGAKSVIQLPNFPQSSKLQKIVNAVTFIFRFPHDIASVLVKSSDPFGPYHKKEHQLSRNNNLITSGKIPLSKIKEVRDWNRTSFAGVVIAAFTGALRTLILEQWGEVPEYISANIALPLPSNSDKLGNTVTGVVLSLPVGLSDPRLRLYAIEANATSLKNSTLPLFVYFFFKGVGSLPAFLTNSITKHTGPTADLSIVPGPIEEAILFGQPIIDCSFMVGFNPGNIGIGLTSMSYNGNIQFIVGIDDSILSDSEEIMNFFMENMLNELELLKQKTV